MYGYMPSEAARLVLGYLFETNCTLTEKQFLDESIHLKEYAQCLTSGYRYPTSIEGYSLLEILKNFYVFTHLSSCPEDDVQDFLDNFINILPKLQRLLKSREIKKRQNSSKVKGVVKSYSQKKDIGKLLQKISAKASKPENDQRTPMEKSNSILNISVVPGSTQNSNPRINNTASLCSFSSPASSICDQEDFSVNERLNSGGHNEEFNPNVVEPSCGTKTPDKMYTETDKTSTAQTQTLNTGCASEFSQSIHLVQTEQIYNVDGAMNNELSLCKNTNLYTKMRNEFHNNFPANVTSNDWRNSSPISSPSRTNHFTDSNPTITSIQATNSPGRIELSACRTKSPIFNNTVNRPNLATSSGVSNRTNLPVSNSDSARRIILLAPNTPSKNNLTSLSHSPSRTIESSGSQTPSRTIECSLSHTPSRIIESSWSHTPIKTIESSLSRTPSRTIESSQNHTHSRTIKSSQNHMSIRVIESSPSHASGRTIESSPSHASGRTIESSPSHASGRTIESSPSHASGRTIESSPSHASVRTIESSPSHASGRTIESSPNYMPNKIISPCSSNPSLSSKTSNRIGLNSSNHTPSNTSPALSSHTPKGLFPTQHSQRPTLTNHSHNGTIIPISSSKSSNFIVPSSIALSSSNRTNTSSSSNITNTSSSSNRTNTSSSSNRTNTSSSCNGPYAPVSKRCVSNLPSPNSRSNRDRTTVPSPMAISNNCATNLPSPNGNSNIKKTNVPSPRAISSSNWTNVPSPISISNSDRTNVPSPVISNDGINVPSPIVISNSDRNIVPSPLGISSSDGSKVPSPISISNSDASSLSSPIAISNSDQTSVLSLSKISNVSSTRPQIISPSLVHNETNIYSPTKTIQPSNNAPIKNNLPSSYKPSKTNQFLSRNIVSNSNLSPVPSPQSVVYYYSANSTPQSSVISNGTASPQSVTYIYSVESNGGNCTPRDCSVIQTVTEETAPVEPSTRNNFNHPQETIVEKISEPIVISIPIDNDSDVASTTSIPSPSFPNLQDIHKLPQTPLKNSFYLRQHSPLDFSKHSPSQLFRMCNQSNDITPANSIKPCLPSRYPDALSPRYHLALQRSQVASLTTPVKEFPPPDSIFCSPRRKNLIPRRRLLAASPSLSQRNNDAEASPAPSLPLSQQDENPNYSVMLEELINYTPLIEKLTQNINQVVFTDKNETPIKERDKTTEEEKKTLESNLPDSLIKDIIDKTESDPVFSEMLNMFFDKPDSSRDSFDVASCMDDLANSVTLHKGIEEDSSDVNADVAQDLDNNDSSETVETPNLIENQDIVLEKRKNIETQISNATIDITATISADIKTTSGSALVLESDSDVLKPGVYIISHDSETNISSTPSSIAIQTSNQNVSSNIYNPGISFDSAQFGTCVKVLNQPIMSTMASISSSNAMACRNTLLLNATAVTPVKIAIPDVHFLNLSNNPIVGVPQVVLNQNYKTSNCVPVFRNSLSSKNSARQNVPKRRKIQSVPGNSLNENKKKAKSKFPESGDQLYVRNLKFDTVGAESLKPKKAYSRSLKFDTNTDNLGNTSPIRNSDSLPENSSSLKPNTPLTSPENTSVPRTKDISSKQESTQVTTKSSVSSKESTIAVKSKPRVINKAKDLKSITENYKSSKRNVSKKTKVNAQDVRTKIATKLANRDDKEVAAALVSLAGIVSEPSKGSDRNSKKTSRQGCKKKYSGNNERNKKSQKLLEKMDVDKFLEKIHPSDIN